MANNKTEKKTTKKPKNNTKQPLKESFWGKVKHLLSKKIGSDTPATDEPEGMPRAEITRFCIGALLFIIS